MFIPLLLLVYAFDVALVSGTFEELKKRVLERNIGVKRRDSKC